MRKREAYRSGVGVHCGDSAMAMGVSRPCLSGPENRAPAGPPKRRPARKSLQIPCVAKTLAGILADVSQPGTIGGKAKDLPVGQVRLPWAMRTQREISGHMLGYTIVYLMATDRQVFESSERKRYDILAVLHPQ